jgi:predicted membrane protein
MNMESRRCSTRSSSAGLVLGVGAILLGLVLLLEQIPGFRESRALEFIKNLWPLILIAMGIAKLQSRNVHRPMGGWFLIVGGFILLAVILGHGRFDTLIAPALFLCAGIFIVLRALQRKRRTTNDLPESEDFIKGTAILSGFKHRVPSQAFKGGELTAIFGGFDLDLRQVRMDSDSAHIDVFLLFGGGEIRVPENWDVTIQATTIAGGVGDKISTPPTAEKDRPRLVLTGLILFGGIEVKR